MVFKLTGDVPITLIFCLSYLVTQDKDDALGILLGDCEFVALFGVKFPFEDVMSAG